MQFKAITWRRLALLFAAAFIGCFFATKAGASDIYSFQPPAGWQNYMQTNDKEPAMAIWRGPTDHKFGENILIVVKRYPGTLARAANTEGLKAQFPGAHVSSQSMKVCGGHAAVYVYMLAPWHGQTLVSENILSVWNGRVFSATYSHLQRQQTVEAARSALTTLCPASDSAAD